MRTRTDPILKEEEGGEGEGRGGTFPSLPAAPCAWEERLKFLPTFVDSWFCVHAAFLPTEGRRKEKRTYARRRFFYSFMSLEERGTFVVLLNGWTVPARPVEGLQTCLQSPRLIVFHAHFIQLQTSIQLHALLQTWRKARRKVGPVFPMPTYHPSPAVSTTLPTVTFCHTKTLTL